MRLVVTCHADGSVETLLKDRIMDTRKLGQRTIERVSEIIPTEDGETFMIKWLRGPRKNKWEEWSKGRPILFRTYEDAVEHEIEQVNVMRLAGGSFV